jgi:hypothetical protein
MDTRCCRSNAREASRIAEPSAVLPMASTETERLDVSHWPRPTPGGQAAKAMERIRNSGWIRLGSYLACAALLLSSCAVLADGRPDQTRLIGYGMTTDEIRQLLGTPDRVSPDASREVWWYNASQGGLWFPIMVEFNPAGRVTNFDWPSPPRGMK